MKDPDVAFLVDVDADDFSPFASVHRLRQAWPALDETIRIWEFRRFRVLGLLRARGRAKHEYRRERSHDTEFRLPVHERSIL